jgi:hypothetical protein
MNQNRRNSQARLEEKELLKWTLSEGKTEGAPEHKR